MRRVPGLSTQTPQSAQTIIPFWVARRGNKHKQRANRMSDRNTKRLSERITFLETINENQCKTIERLQAETASQARQIEILKGKKR